ncbi:hypothetical protein GCM10023156_67930 [Novipirellula rosea]|uniref:Uncharacterized protein n=1 Tax=Novipirellula rosea TaxID=1031540 RepID=A0ABP8NSA3_9BACT
MQVQTIFSQSESAQTKEAESLFSPPEAADSVGRFAASHGFVTIQPGANTQTANFIVVMSY